MSVIQQHNQQTTSEADHPIDTNVTSMVYHPEQTVLDSSVINNHQYGFQAKPNEISVDVLSVLIATGQLVWVQEGTKGEYHAKLITPILFEGRLNNNNNNNNIGGDDGTKPSSVQKVRVQNLITKRIEDVPWCKIRIQPAQRRRRTPMEGTERDQQRIRYELRTNRMLSPEDAEALYNATTRKKRRKKEHIFT